MDREKLSVKPRRLASLLVGLVFAFGVATPALGYTHVNNEHVRLQRLDSVQCSTPIRIDALVTGKHGVAVSGATVSFVLSNGRAGDILSPASSETNASGHASTSLQLRCIKGPRTVRAYTSGGARASITFVCNERQGCTSAPHGSAPRTHLRLWGF